jgi:diguanylate cyclase (GGDEF)-like protein
MASYSQDIILIIDDNPMNIDILFDLLNDQAFKVLVAKNGKVGLERAIKILPSLILLDIIMPEMDGYEVCRCLKQNEITKHIPVIFMTSLAETSDKVKGLNLGAVDYITKPIQQDEVIARINVHLQIQHLTQALKAQNERLHREIKIRQDIQKQLRDTNLALTRSQNQLQKLNQELQHLVNLDGLTQIANRRRFDQYLNQEWNRMRREKKPLSLIICDVDYFKKYNDFYGHQLGDDCLKKIANAITLNLKRPGDLVARYGGEEFGIILPHTDQKGAFYLAQNIQLLLQQLAIVHQPSPINDCVTISMGIATIIPNSNYEVTDLIKFADQALYSAKNQGRDRIEIAQIKDHKTL